MKYTLFTFILLVGFYGVAQVDTTANQGQITMGEVVIEKDKKIFLPQFDKKYQQASVRQFANEPMNLMLQANDPELTWPPYKSDVPFQQITKTYPQSTYQNYVRLGYGNYGSPLAELGVFHRLGSFETASRIFHERFQSGPVNDENSGNSQTLFRLAATRHADNFSFTPRLWVENTQYRFYGNNNRINSGFDPSDLSKVNFNSVGFDLGFSGRKGDFSYYLNPILDLTNQAFTGGQEINQESVFNAEGGIYLKIDETVKTGLALESYVSSYQSGITYNRSLFTVNPWVTYEVDDVSLTGGFNLATGVSDELTQSGFYPEVKAEWAFTKKWVAYGGLSGNVEWNGLKELLSENEFLDDSLTIRNIENRLVFGGGVKGSPLKNVLVDASLNWANLENLPFYVSSPSDSSRFTIVYDEQAVDRVTFKTSLSFSPTTVSTYKASLSLNSYAVNTLDRPWHLPSYVFSMSTSHNVKQKLLFSTNIIAIGGIRAPANVDFGIVNLGSIIDLGIELKYLITNRASVWLDLNNIANNEYERYLGYPVRGLNFKIGGQYRF